MLEYRHSHCLAGLRLCTLPETFTATRGHHAGGPSTILSQLILTIFFNGHVAARTRLGGFLDGFLGGLLPASLLSRSCVHPVGLGWQIQKQLRSETLLLGLESASLEVLV